MCALCSFQPVFVLKSEMTLSLSMKAASEYFTANAIVVGTRTVVFAGPQECLSQEADEGRFVD